MKRLIILAGFIFTSALNVSCREEPKSKNAAEEVGKKDEGVLERTAKKVDKKVNDEIDEEIDDIGDDNK